MHYLPCEGMHSPPAAQGATLSKTSLAVTYFQSFLSLVALISSNGVMLFGRHLPRLSKYFILCLTLLLLYLQSYQ